MIDDVEDVLTVQRVDS